MNHSPCVHFIPSALKHHITSDPPLPLPGPSQQSLKTDHLCQTGGKRDGPLVPLRFPKPSLFHDGRDHLSRGRGGSCLLPPLRPRQLPNARAAGVGETHKETLSLGTERSLSVVRSELCARRRPERDWGRLAGGELVSWIVAVAIITATINMAIASLTLV